MTEELTAADLVELAARAQHLAADLLDAASRLRVIEQHDAAASAHVAGAESPADQDDAVWLDVQQAAKRAGYHWRYVADLCRDKQIHGSQRKRGGKWRIHRDCLDAWLGNQKCAHQIADAARVRRG